MAEYLGVSRQAVSKWENGQAFPDTGHLIRLAELLGVGVDYLTAGSSAETVGNLRLSKLLNRLSLVFFIIGTAAHCVGIFTGEFTRNLIPVFPYLWYGKSLWAVLLNAITALFTVGWITSLAVAISLVRK